MSGNPLDIPATQLEIIATRALITALGKALIKKGLVSHADVASELTPVIKACEANPLLAAELKLVLRSVLDWGLKA